MGFAKYHEDILRRLDEASIFLNYLPPPPTQVVGSRQEVKPITPKPGEWQSFRQQIISLLAELRTEILKLEKQQADYKKLLADPLVVILSRAKKQQEENTVVKQQNEELKRQVLLLQYRLKEAGLWQSSYSSSLAGTSENPKQVVSPPLYSSPAAEEPTAVELALQKAKANKEQNK